MKPVSSHVVAARLKPIFHSMLLVGLASCAELAGCAEGEKNMTIQMTSSAFVQGHAIPKKYTGEGEDVSPPLAWSGLPEGTKELALICDDPDAPRAEPWVHWVIYKLPADAKGLPEGVPVRRLGLSQVVAETRAFLSEP